MYNRKEDQIRRDRCKYGRTMSKIVFNTFRRYPRLTIMKKNLDI